MKTFIQLRDGIGYATLNTTGEPDHTITPDHTNAIEVVSENPDQFLRKQYNEETKSWSDAPIIRFADLNEKGEIVEIKRTVFIHEVSNNSVIMPDEADGSWRFINGEWAAPASFITPSIPNVIDSPEIIEEQNVEEIIIEETEN